MNISGFSLIFLQRQAYNKKKDVKEKPSDITLVSLKKLDILLFIISEC